MYRLKDSGAKKEPSFKLKGAEKEGSGAPPSKGGKPYSRSMKFSSNDMKQTDTELSIAPRQRQYSCSLSGTKQRLSQSKDSFPTVHYCNAKFVHSPSSQNLYESRLRKVKEEELKKLDFEFPAYQAWESFPNRRAPNRVQANVLSCLKKKDSEQPADFANPLGKTDFIDDEFPHTANSLGLKNYLAYEWRGMHCPVKGPGGIRGPAIYGALAAIAAAGLQFIDRLLEQEEQSLSGKYYCRLFLNGVWKYIAVDSYFPVGEEGDLLFTRSINKIQLWSSLIEKAYVKAFGTYRNYVETRPADEDVLNQLLGCATTTLKNYQISAEQIRQALAKQYLVMAATQQVEGLSPKTIYRVSKTIGPDRAQLETPLGVEKPGCSRVVPFDRLQHVVICKVLRGQSYHTTMQVRQKKNSYTGVRLTVAKNCTAFVEFCQMDIRNVPLGKYQYSPCTLVVDNEGEKKARHFKHCKRGSVELKAGSQKVFLIVDWAGREYDLQLGVYSSQPVQMRKIEPAELVQSFEEELSLAEHREMSSWNESHYVDLESQLVFFRFANPLSRPVSVVRRFSLREKVRLLGEGDAKQFRKVLLPGEAATLVFHGAGLASEGSFQSLGI